jgi:DNA-directed RNA polymerase specialized sigma24 family protein
MTSSTKAMADAGLLRELWNFSLRLTCNVQLAEQLVAETYLTATRRGIRQSKSKPLRIVMFSVVLAVWIKHRDGPRRFFNDSRLEHRPVAEDPCLSIGSLNSLAEQERIAVILVDGQKLIFDDAAWVLGTNTETLAKWLLRAYSSRLPETLPL